MAVRTRSSRKHNGSTTTTTTTTTSEEEEITKEPQNDADHAIILHNHNDDAVVELSTTSDHDKTHKAPTKPSPRTLGRTKQQQQKQQQREALRSRNMGVGLSISTETTTAIMTRTNHKIVFDEEEAMVDNKRQESNQKVHVDSKHKSTVEKGENNNNNDDDEEESDSDDEAVEEMKSSVAKEAIRIQRANERDILAGQKIRKKRTRTKSMRTHTALLNNKDEEKDRGDDDEDDDDLQEGFFAQVDSEMAAQRKQRKKDRHRLNVTSDGPVVGRHTTFVTVEEQQSMEPIPMDHNIELVVLGHEDLEDENGDVATRTVGPGRLVQARNIPQAANDVGMDMNPTETSQLFARNRLLSGKDQAKKMGTRKKKQTDPGWKRSKKMNVLAFRRRGKGRGKAAAVFAVQKS